MESDWFFRVTWTSSTRFNGRSQPVRALCYWSMPTRESRLDFPQFGSNSINLMRIIEKKNAYFSLVGTNRRQLQLGLLR